ncbi:MAG: hypothetical protein QOI98_940 [Solirubrobacteraceae bacterium]|nr:hypothetical protein [Solirubrobacteraceae bacterium]
MRSHRLKLALSGSIVVVGGALVAVSVAFAATPQASASVETCHRAATQPDRFVAFVADARAVPGSATMAIRFDLQRRRAGERYHTIHAAGLGQWHRSEPGVDIFRYRKQVSNLPAPANYRAIARYRWYDRRGSIVARARRVSSPCRQSDSRPDLLAEDLALQPGPNADRVRYVITLRNTGQRAAGAFDTLLYVDGVRQGSLTVPDLAGKAEQSLAIEGKRCGLGSSVLVVLDPADRVDESRESNNTTRFVCPL